MKIISSTPRPLPRPCRTAAPGVLLLLQDALGRQPAGPALDPSIDTTNNTLCPALTPLQGQVHGCPYKTFSADSLRAALLRLQVAPSKIDEAVSKARNGHYQLACAAVSGMN